MTKATRRRIALGVKRYWRRVRQIRREGHISTLQARLAYKDVRRLVETLKISWRDAIKVYIESLGDEWRSPNPEGEFAFNLRDRDREQKWGIAKKFLNKERVCIDVVITKHLSTGAIEPVAQFTATFRPASYIHDEEGFWKGYHDAVKAGYAHLELESLPEYEIRTMRIFKC